MDKKRSMLKLRVPPTLAEEVKHEAWQRGLSMNQMACILLRYALEASAGKASLVDRLNLMARSK